MRSLMLIALAVFAGPASAQVPSGAWLAGLRWQHMPVIHNQIGVDIERRVISFGESEFRVALGATSVLQSCSLAHRAYDAVTELSMLFVQHAPSRMSQWPSVRFGIGAFSTRLGDQCTVAASIRPPGDSSPVDVLFPDAGAFAQGGVGWQLPVANRRLGIDLSERYYSGWRPSKVAVPVIRVSWAW